MRAVPGAGAGRKPGRGPPRGRRAGAEGRRVWAGGRRAGAGGRRGRGPLPVCTCMT